MALGLDNVLGKPNLPDALKRLGALTGTLFLAKNIDTIALGQYADPSTWFTTRFTWPHGWRAEIWAALCIHYVDTPEGPRVLALSAGAKGTIDIGIGKLQLYATVTLAIGRWRNEAVASGVVVKIEAGVRIRVFRVINFGAVIEVELDWLGPPAYSRQSFTFKIETPWWLPDVSVRFEHHSGTPRLSQMQVASTPLIGAAALPPATRAAMPIGTTALLGSGEAAVLTLDQLRAAGPATVSDAAYDGLAPVATDSRIMLDFKPSLDAPVTVVPDTPDDVGVQTSGEVSARYELVQLGVRRRKRFGPGAGVWTDLLTPESTRIDTPEDVTAVFNSARPLRMGHGRLPRRPDRHPPSSGQRGHRLLVRHLRSGRRRRHRDDVPRLAMLPRRAPAAAMARGELRGRAVRRTGAGRRAIHRQPQHPDVAGWPAAGRGGPGRRAGGQRSRVHPGRRACAGTGRAGVVRRARRGV